MNAGFDLLLDQSIDALSDSSFGHIVQGLPDDGFTGLEFFSDKRGQCLSDEGVNNRREIFLRKDAPQLRLQFLLNGWLDMDSQFLIDHVRKQLGQALLAS